MQLNSKLFSDEELISTVVQIRSLINTLTVFQLNHKKLSFMLQDVGHS